MSTCKEMAVTSSHLAVGDIASRETRRTPANISHHSMLSFTKYYLKHCENDAKHLADELIDFHCQTINPMTSWSVRTSSRPSRLKQGFRILHSSGII